MVGLVCSMHSSGRLKHVIGIPGTMLPEEAVGLLVSVLCSLPWHKTADELEMLIWQRMLMVLCQQGSGDLDEN